MMALLMTTGAKGVDIPGSGIGPTTLISGNTELGYFGSFRLDDYDLYSKVLALLVDRSEFVEYRQDQDNEWLKFMINGRVVYTTRRPIGIGLSYSDLSDSGMVLGTDTFIEGISGRQDAKLIASDGVDDYILIARLSTTYAGMGASTAVNAFPDRITDPAALIGETNTIINALAVELNYATGVEPIPAMGSDSLTSPPKYFEDIFDTRAALTQELILSKVRAGNAYFRYKRTGAQATREVTTLDKNVSYRPWLDLAELGTIPIGDIRTVEYSTNYPRAVVINESTSKDTDPLLPSILMPTNQLCIGPWLESGKELTASTLVPTNQMSIGPYISIPNPTI